MSAVGPAIEVKREAAPATASGSAWMPRSGRDEAAGCVWLPRMIDKARRYLEGEATGQDLLWPYMFGVNDPADAQLLRFLGLTNEDVLEVVRSEPDDEAAAAVLARRSGRTPEECAAWSARYRRLNAPFLAMIDADEGRRPPGVGTTLLRLLYNGVIMPPAYPIYRRAERWRSGAATGVGDGGDGRPSWRGFPLLLASGLAVGGGLMWWRRARRRRAWREQVAERTREAAATLAARASRVPKLVA